MSASESQTSDVMCGRLILRAFIEHGSEDGSTDEGQAWMSKPGRQDRKGIDFASQVVIEVPNSAHQIL